MPDDLASLFSLIFFLRDVFGFIIILPRDWISEKISACIRHIKRITQRSRLLPDLKETVLQLWKLIPLYSEQRGFEGKLPFLRACCLQLVKVMGEPLLGAYAPALKEHFGLLHKAVPQSTIQHMGTPCNSSPGLCCVPDTQCLSAHLRLVPPLYLMCIAVVRPCCNVSAVLHLYFFGIHLSFRSWHVQLKNANNGYSIRWQISPSPDLSTTSSYSSKGIVWINERLFITGTKCSDMPGMSKLYYASFRAPLFRDKNDNFMPLPWNHKYHFKPSP